MKRLIVTMALALVLLGAMVMPAFTAQSPELPGLGSREGTVAASRCAPCNISGRWSFTVPTLYGPMTVPVELKQHGRDAAIWGTFTFLGESLSLIGNVEDCHIQFTVSGTLFGLEYQAGVQGTVDSCNSMSGTWWDNFGDSGTWQARRGARG